MKKRPPLFFCILPLLIPLFAACAGSRPAVATIAGPPEAAKTPKPEDKTTEPLEAILRRVKRNGGDIQKYYTLDGDSLITVRADINYRDEYDNAYDNEYNIVYDLLNAAPLGETRFRVEFTVEEKNTQVQRIDNLIWELEPGDAGILLAFDDRFENSWADHFDLFDRYGAKVTFFVQGEYCAFCTEAQNRGHDIGYHTLHHLDLRKLSQEAFLVETKSAAGAFRSAGIPLSAFAYPFGFSEPWMHDTLSRDFAILRGYGVSFRVYNRETVREGYISSKALDNIVFKDDELFDRYLTLMLRTVKFLGGSSVVPLTTHDISDTANWGIKPRRLEQVLKTARDLKLNFYRYGDFAGE
ncbi:hypothetical protein AGMMS49546_17540 [Spirochaetia bacterium]|nr:hypothetical protein AGMMS49546_17540 [Spirochaetia bacterium]